MRWIYFAAYLATIPAANLMIQHVGTECVPAGPCLIPVAPGLYAPSGVLIIGLALLLRDAVQEALGSRWAAVSILLGAGLSFAISPPALAAASAAAFLVSEAADMAVYTPMRRRGFAAGAILASGAAGAVVDSALFLWLAFGSLDFLAGQVAGKMWVTAIAFAMVAWAKHRRTANGAANH